MQNIRPLRVAYVIHNSWNALRSLISSLNASQHADDTSDTQSAVDKETDAKLAQIAESYKNNKDAVVKKLLDRVVLVKPELHRNLKKAS